MGRISTSGYRSAKTRDGSVWVFHKMTKIGEVYVNKDAGMYTAVYDETGEEMTGFTRNADALSGEISRIGVLWIRRKHKKQNGIESCENESEKVRVVPQPKYRRAESKPPSRKTDDRYNGPPKPWQNGITEQDGKLYFHGYDIDAKADEYDLPSWWWTPRAEWTLSSMMSHWTMTRQIEYMKQGATLQEAIQLEQQDRLENYADVDITEIIKQEYGDSIV